MSDAAVGEASAGHQQHYSLGGQRVVAHVSTAELGAIDVEITSAVHSPDSPLHQSCSVSIHDRRPSRKCGNLSGRHRIRYSATVGEITDVWNCLGPAAGMDRLRLGQTLVCTGSVGQSLHVPQAPGSRVGSEPFRGGSH